MNDLFNEYYEKLKELNEKVFIYVINGNEVSENEFKNYVLNVEKIRENKKNEKDTKEDNI